MASFARLAGRVVVGAGVLALSPVLGLAALAGTAMVGLEPKVFAVCGLAVFASVFFLGLLLCVPRPGATWGRWLRALVVLGVEAAVVWQVSTATLNPAAGQPPPAKVAGQREWRLTTGSELAYVRRAPKRVTRAEPVVFLHGGPGVADLAANAAFYGRLASAGFQVYVYDQLGAGRSARLTDPGGYGLTRDVADLEAIRRTVGADRLNLVAQGYGAQLAAAYLAEHPDRVARAVLYSPAGLSPGRTTTGRTSTDRPGSTALLGPAGMLGPAGVPDPRTLALSTLLRVDPQAAHAFAGDHELDAHLTLIRHQTSHPCPAPTAPAASKSPAPSKAAGPFDGSESQGDVVGGYVGWAGRLTPSSLRSDLAGVKAPVLVVKGACDEQSWSAAMAYRHALPTSRFTYVTDSAAYLTALRTFLTDRPVTPYDGDTPPASYRGPA
ncbi:alpha/beta fold hydrolase [Nonomuraea solani]|uniref:alpha/beta fold hydrolase n=1 Tax=Nonomuraea solani TaxID=1144553 RepID=UPI00135B3ACA|nr:alpha/beta fold hydrolase [Nonomuraea solani]